MTTSSLRDSSAPAARPTGAPVSFDAGAGPRNMVELFETSSRKFARLNLFGTKSGGEWIWTTYEQVKKLVDDFRGALASLGVDRGDRVAIIANNRIEWPVAAYATYGRGAAFVPMYESQLASEWEFIV